MTKRASNLQRMYHKSLFSNDMNVALADFVRDVVFEVYSKKPIPKQTLEEFYKIADELDKLGEK